MSSLPRARSLIPVAALLAVLATSSALAQSADAQRYIIAASRLYENLEYERALDQLKKARGVSGGMEDDVSIALYEGIILLDMGKKDEAVAAFKEGLYLKPEANLPVKVAPKIAQVFTATKNDVLKELQPILAKKRAEEEKRKLEEDKRKAEALALAEKQRLADEEAARLKAQGTDRPEDPKLTPRDDPNQPLAGVEKKQKRGVPVAPIVLGSVAVAAVGIASVFGYMSSTQVNAARSATFQSETVERLNQASSNALIANISYGVAGAAAIAAFISFFVIREAPPPPPESL